jgi:LAO/AO transport system kinase
MGPPDVEQLAQRLREGDRRALARAITLVESSRQDHRQASLELLSEIMPFTGNSFRLGISGVPGVGKSTFIEAFGLHVLGHGHRIAVLTIDPSSPVTGGAILGDKTRMQELARSDGAYIRPSAAGNVLGGVNRRTRDALLLCEAAGYDLILVETVGIGQSETAVARMTDMFLLLLLPGSGDDLQGIKRGATELADMIVINKADGEMQNAAEHTAADYRHALHLLRLRTAGWTVPVNTISALQGAGVGAVWDSVVRYREIVSANDIMSERRGKQARAWLWEEVSDMILHKLQQHPGVAERVTELEKEVVSLHMPATVAAENLIDLFMKGEAP